MKVRDVLEKYDVWVERADELSVEDGYVVFRFFLKNGDNAFSGKAIFEIEIDSSGQEDYIFHLGSWVNTYVVKYDDLHFWYSENGKIIVIDLESKQYYKKKASKPVYTTDYREWVDKVVDGWNWDFALEKEKFRKYLLQWVEEGGVAKMFFIRDMMVWYKLWLKDEINKLQKEIAKVDGKKHPVYKFKLRLLASTYGRIRADIKAILNVERSPRKKNGFWHVYNTSPRWLNKLFNIWMKIPLVQKHVILYHNDERRRL